ncbi:MAG: Uma2 family endonuclease [Pseudoxanthomonas sp.]
MNTQLRPACYEDLFELPDNVIGQIINGTLHVQPRPAGPHTLAASVLMADINTPFHRGRGGPGGWWILTEPELHLGMDILVPDLAGWRRERMPSIPNAAFFTLPPDWICEVLSPSTARIDRVEKMAIYARHGVQWLWLLDPLAHTLETYTLSNGHWLLEASYADDARVRAVPFDAVELELDALWLPPAEEQ